MVPPCLEPCSELWPELFGERPSFDGLRRWPSPAPNVRAKKEPPLTALSRNGEGAEVSSDVLVVALLLHAAPPTQGGWTPPPPPSSIEEKHEPPWRLF